MNSTIKEIEQSLTFTQGEVETLKEQFKTESEERISEVGLLKDNCLGAELKRTRAEHKSRAVH